MRAQLKEWRGVIQNMHRCIQGQMGITPHVCLRIYRQLLFSCFCFKVFCPYLYIYSNLHKNRHSIFLKEFLTEIFFFKIPLWRKIDDFSSYFIFLVKIWNENSISISIHSDITYFWIWLFGVANIQEGTIQRPGALMSKHCLLSHCWYDM